MSNNPNLIRDQLVPLLEDAEANLVEIQNLLRCSDNFDLKTPWKAPRYRVEDVPGIEAVWQQTADAVAPLAMATNSHTRGAALQVLVLAPTETSLAAITALTEDADPQVRNLAIQGLIDQGDSRHVARLEASMLDDFENVRMFAVLGLGRIGGEASLPALKIRLHEELEPAVAAIVAQSYLKLGGQAVVSELLDVLSNPKTPMLLTLALQELLGELAPAQLGDLADRLESAEDPAVKARLRELASAAPTAVGASEAEITLDELVDQFEAGLETASVNLEAALAEYPDAIARTAWLRHLVSHSPTVPLGLLSRLLEDRCGAVAMLTLELLSRHDNAGMNALLSPLFGRALNAIRGDRSLYPVGQNAGIFGVPAYVEVLTSHGSELRDREAPPINEVMRRHELRAWASPAAAVMMSALRLVRSVGLQTQLSAVEASLTVAEPAVRVEAVRTLLELAPPDLTERLQRLEMDAASTVKYYALSRQIEAGDNDAIERLVGAESPILRMTAAWFLGARLDRSEARSGVERLSKDELEPVRNAALAVLEQFG